MKKLLLVSLLLYLFFSYSKIMNILFFIIPLILIIATFVVKNYKSHLLITRDDKMWLGFTCVNILSLPIGSYIKEGITFSAILLIIILLKIILSNSGDIYKSFIKIIISFSCIHVICTILQVYLGDFILKINKLLLTQESYNVNFSQYLRGKFGGITSQTGTDAFYITIFICIMFCFFVENSNKKYKIIYFLFMIIGLSALIFTRKRGLLIFNIIVMIVVLTIRKIHKFKNEHIILYGIILLIIVTVIIGFSVNNIEIIQKYLVDEDITSGRINIYAEVFRMIRESGFVIGNGIGSVENVIGIKAHNVYLQVWAEVGVIGLIMYLFALFGTLRTSINKYREQIYNKSFILISIYMQLIFIFYGCTGNPLYDYFMISLYFIFISIPYADYVYKKLN